MESSDTQIRFDPATGQIVEYVPQQVSADSFETRLQDANNRLNSDRAELTGAEQAYEEALKEIEHLSQAVEDKRQIVHKAEDEVAFQTRRKEQYDAAVAAREAAPAQDTDGVAEDSGEVAVPVRQAESFPA